MQPIAARTRSRAAWTGAFLRAPIACGAALALAALAGCGGAAPEPKDSDDVAHAAPKAAEPKANAAPAPEPAAASSGSPSLGAASMAPGSDATPGGADDPWMAPHQMSPKDVLVAVRPAQGKAQACFREGYKRDPSTSGEVKIRFVITNDGVVRVWRDDGSSMSDEDVITCVGDLIKKLKFPKQKSPGDAWGVYTANFQN